MRQPKRRTTCFRAYFRLRCCCDNYARMKSCCFSCACAVWALILLPTLPLIEQEARFSSIAEGFSSDEGPIEVGYRAFTAPQLQEMTSGGLRVESIDVLPRVFRLQVGQRRSLRELRVTARDSQGAIIVRIPFSVGLEDVDPEIVSVESLRVNGHEIEGTRAGQSRLRFMAAIPRDDGTSAVSMIRIVVTDE